MKTTRETHLDLLAECDYIVSKALAGKNVIVIIGCLVFLAYDTGDAFALDTEDKFACQLCDERMKQRYPLFETATKWCFEWPWTYFLANGYIYFKRVDSEDTSGLPWLKSGAIERQLKRHNRKAGTNYNL